MADPKGARDAATPPTLLRASSRTRVSLDILGVLPGRPRAKRNDLDALAELARSLRVQTEALCRQLEVLSAASYLVELEEVLEHRRRGDVTKPLEALTPAAPYAAEPTVAGSFVTCSECGRPSDLAHDPRCPAAKTSELVPSHDAARRTASTTRPVPSSTTSLLDAPTPPRAPPPGFAAQAPRCTSPSPAAARAGRAGEFTNPSRRSPGGTQTALPSPRAPMGLMPRPRRAAARRGAGVIVMDLLRIVLSIVFPPLGVFLRVGFSGHFWLNLLLTLCCYIPGLVHAIWLIAQGSQHRLRTSF